MPQALGTPPHCGGTYRRGRRYVTSPPFAALTADSLRSNNAAGARHAAALRRHVSAWSPIRNLAAVRCAHGGLAPLEQRRRRSARRRIAAARIGVVADT